MLPIQGVAWPRGVYQGMEYGQTDLAQKGPGPDSYGQTDLAQRAWHGGVRTNRLAIQGRRMDRGPEGQRARLGRISLLRGPGADLGARPLFYMCIHLSVYLYVCLCVCLCVCLSLCVLW